MPRPTGITSSVGPEQAPDTTLDDTKFAFSQFIIERLHTLALLLPDPTKPTVWDTLCDIRADPQKVWQIPCYEV